MRILLTFTPLIVATFLISCGPGITGGDRSSVGKYAGAILGTEGLIFYTRMDESGGSVSDFLGRAIGIPEGAPIYRVQGGMQNNGGFGESQPNVAIDFNTATACLNFGEVSELRNLQPPFTIVFMARGNGGGPFHVIGYWGPFNDYEWKVELTAGFSVQFVWSPEGTTQNPVSFGGYSSAWDHFAIRVESNGDLYGYQNGNNIGFTASAVNGQFFQSQNNQLRIGCNNSGEYLNGGLDEIAIFNRALSHEDIVRINNARNN